MRIEHAKSKVGGYEISTKGDKRFSALVAKLSDGRTIEEAYQLDVKGYRAISNNWRVGKGKRPLHTYSFDLYTEYLKLWQQWATENPALMVELRKAVLSKPTPTLTDAFAISSISQSRALASILNETVLHEQA